VGDLRLLVNVITANGARVSSGTSASGGERGPRLTRGRVARWGRSSTAAFKPHDARCDPSPPPPFHAGRPAFTSLPLSVTGHPSAGHPSTQRNNATTSGPHHHCVGTDGDCAGGRCASAISAPGGRRDRCRGRQHCNPRRHDQAGGTAGVQSSGRPRWRGTRHFRLRRAGGTELETSTPPRSAQIAWAAVEVPSVGVPTATGPTRGTITMMGVGA